jgi:hypothetical protein
MADDAYGTFISPTHDEDNGESSAEGTAADITIVDDAPGDDSAPGTLGDVLGHAPKGDWAPSPEDMTLTNSNNATSREEAIKGGMDEGTANIIYPEFSTPEDMNRIN